MWRHFRSIVLGMILLLAAAPAFAAKRVALVIANSSYQHAGRLENPVRDAQAVAGALSRLGFDVLSGLDLTASDFGKTLVEFSKRLRGADVALFYYAGHGLQLNEQNYLMPVDARLEDEFAVKRETFNLLDVIEQMEGQARVNLVLLDACRNNPLADGLRQTMKSAGRSAAIGRGLARMASGRGETLVVYAAEPGKVAEDGAGRNSPFTQAFLKHVETPGIDVEVMLKRVTADVRTATEDRQRPERLSKLTIEFYFNENRVTVTAEPVGGGSGGNTPAAGPARDAAGEAAQAWTILRETTDPAELETFLQRFGTTFYGDLARNRLEKLKSAARPPAPVASALTLAGHYNVVGRNLKGQTYRGKVTISTEGNLYRVRWRIGTSETYEGKGTLQGDTLVVDWGEKYPVIYKVGADRVLRGTWANGKASEDLSPDP